MEQKTGLKLPKIRMKKSVAMTLTLILGLSIIIFVTMLLFNVTDFGITIASFGATIFMILSQKNMRKRQVFGAYLIAAFAGYLASRFSHVISLNAAIAGVAAILIMTFFDMQHAPAIGMSIAIVLNKFSAWTDALIIMCVFLIFGMTWLLKMFLQNPEKMVKFVELEEEKIKWNFSPKERPEYFDLDKNKNKQTN